MTIQLPKSLRDPFDRDREAELQQSTPDWQAKLAAWEQQAAAGQPLWQVLQDDRDAFLKNDRS